MLSALALAGSVAAQGLNLTVSPPNGPDPSPNQLYAMEIDCLAGADHHIDRLDVSNVLEEVKVLVGTRTSGGDNGFVLKDCPAPAPAPAPAAAPAGAAAAPAP